MNKTPAEPKRSPGKVARREGRPLRKPKPPPEATALLVEESSIIARMLKKSISTLPGYRVEIASSRAEAVELFADSPERFTAAVVDLELPDAQTGEVVDLTLEAGIATIVLTGNYDEETRARILEKRVVDYFLKGDQSLAGLNDTLDRLRTNPDVEILVVDDSSAFRLMCRRLLETHRFTVREAGDGAEALEVLEAAPGITAVITDYEMPRMNGIELVSALRDRKPREDLAIIGVSALGDRYLPAKYLKHGADDFLTKPFESEEFYCRVYRSVTNIEQIQRITRAAYTDQLTDLPNRLQFFTFAPPLFEKAVHDGTPFALAMLDIDYFKRINDTFGHAAGDAALQHLARLLETNLEQSDIVARFGGEEFCVLSVGPADKAVSNKFERLRRAVEHSQVVFEGETIRFTLSMGVAIQAREHLDAVINRADEFLYQAKESGRNRVLIEQAGSSESKGRTSPD